MEAQSPIPNPLPNDDEDVSWALSTAGALWGRGERAEALKWLRRAAEQASDVNDDVRALALFKAAAEVTQTASMTPPPPSTSMAPPATSVAPQAMAPSSFPPAAAPAPAPPPRKAPPSLPPRTVAPPPVPSSRSVPPARTTPPPAPARQSPSSAAPSPVTKQSRNPAPAPAPQISPAARSMPSSAIAAAGTPARRAAPAPAPRASAPARGAAPGATVPTRPVASRPSATTSTPPPGAATERPSPSRSGRAFEEVLALQNPQGGLGFDDLDENTQVLQAVRSGPSLRQPAVPDIEESFHGVLTEVADELTDPRARVHAIDDIPPEDQTGPISAPERTAVTKWTDAERAALMAAPDTQSPESTSRRFAPLLAHRVAVVAGRAGEIRLVPLDSAGAPPMGAAIALLVPLSAADGDLVAQLFGSLE